MKSNGEIYLEKIEDLFGEADVINKVDCPDGGKPIYIFTYFNLPEEGLTTFVTYGLSEGNHPDWKNGKPELIVTLETEDEDWGFAAGFFASAYRGEKAFSYSSLYTTDSPLSEESDMIGFFVFTPAILDPEEFTIQMPDKPIYLKGLYPIYKEEVELYQSIGLEAFWHLEDFDLFDVKRKNLALG